MKIHLMISDEMAEMLLEQGLADLPQDFADSIRNNAVKRSEAIKLVVQRNLAKMFAQSIGKPSPDADFDTSDVEPNAFDQATLGDDA